VARAAIRPERIDGWANPPLPADSGHWVVKSEVGEIDDPDDWYAIEDEQSREIVVYNESRPDSDQAAHIARHDPARVLAEVEAKRAILELHKEVPHKYDTHPASYCASCGDQGCCGHDVDYPCETIKALAQPYAGRPGWREEWAT
jgi:hypothetical protein